MTALTKSPVKPKVYAAVEVERHDITALVQQLVIEESDEAAAVATLTLEDRELVLMDVLYESLKVVVDLGYTNGHGIVFRGVITALRAKLSGQTPTVEVEAMNPLIFLARQPRTNCHSPKPLPDLIKAVLQQPEYPLIPGRIELPAAGTDSKSSPPKQSPVRQLEETDLALLYRLAHETDTKIYLDHKIDGSDRFNMVSTEQLVNAEPIKSPLCLDENLHSFSLDANAANTAQEHSLVTTDPLTGETVKILQKLTKDAQESLWEADADHLTRLGKSATGLISLWQQTQLKRQKIQSFGHVPPRQVGAPARSANNLNGVRGDYSRRFGYTLEGEAAGDFALRPCRMVRIKGIGGRWSGLWYVAQVTHRVEFGQRTYQCSIVCKR